MINARSILDQTRFKNNGLRWPLGAMQSNDIYVIMDEFAWTVYEEYRILKK